MYDNPKMLLPKCGRGNFCDKFKNPLQAKPLKVLKGHKIYLQFVFKYFAHCGIIKFSIQHIA